jgi:hypothetical protein
MKELGRSGSRHGQKEATKGGGLLYLNSKGVIALALLYILWRTPGISQQSPSMILGTSFQ